MTLLSTINANGNNYGIMGIAVPGSCATPAGTEVKVCTFTDNFELKAGGIFLIKFTYANTYGDGSTTYPKLQVNGTNYVMRRADGNYVESGEWDNNATLTFLFDGTDFILPAGSATGAASVPLGSILAIYSNSVPDGYLPCNGVQFDPAQFAGLYALLGDDHTPDLRECALVGIGQNGTDVFDSTETDPSTGQAGTQDHDVYTLGEFKDDRVQNHEHTVVETNGSNYPEPTVSSISGSSKWVVVMGNIKGFKASDIVNGRHGSTTRGKRKGVNYIIKATSGLPDDQQDYILNQLAPVDTVAVGNVHSVTSDAVARAINPASTTIIESTSKRSVSVTLGQTTWWGMSSYPEPSVPQGKRIISRFAKCSNANVAVTLVSFGDNKTGILTCADETATVQIWLCIEVADL